MSRIPQGPILAAAWLACGCGGLGTKPGTPEVGSGSPSEARAWDSFCVAWATTVAARTAICTGAPELAPRSKRASDCDRGRASILAGRTHFDEPAAARCLGELSGLACAPFLASAVDGYACRAALVGSVPLAGGCLFDGDCADSVQQFCDQSRVCQATCQKRIPIGDFCSTITATGCVAGSTCDFGASPSRCTKLAEEGEPCGTGVAVCTIGLTCAATGICAVLGPGSDCQGSAWGCGPFMACQYHPTPDPSECVPYRLPGETCTPGEGGCKYLSFCQPGEAGTGTCVPGPRVGEPCGVILQDAEIVEKPVCLEGWCDRQLGELDGTCQPFRQLGEDCRSNQECDTSGGRRCEQGVCVGPTCGEPL